MVGAGWVLLGERPTTKEGEMMAVWTWGEGKEVMRVSVAACGVVGEVGRKGRSRVSSQMREPGWVPLGGSLWAGEGG